ncbi:Phosphatidylglycerol/phosphatidylinositol transfer protein [Coemansia sp. RSA 2706]|nr:Phosphatidylglycerol/phosphatidylinositol transfer protein [Coemansia sp. RSA 2711]KAJ1842604.1 Phosphatidylglycerol/phosphatidylinositol transfer protein [Coemansia sp. RSA 2708]KAJ2306931.1 Phosphatidylglycerol/phosphatidylinositol transfer protein [Coemansia sp. RSA 2705]KAJ2307476.1 Phosphatidylglycerol/phosphatidylinositol transfer protein [Coemansia sp. RSA 2706]KAJ2318317.1 Phosphatidylglycerol/phosphatidylinositol transfer protein [Coemansia sp. RSA 2704]KAJ2328393.1 Phosphatidylgly
MKLLAPVLFALGAAHTSAAVAFGEHLQLAVQEASGIFIDMLDARVVGDDLGKNRTLNDIIRDVSHEEDLIDIKYVRLEPEKPKRSTPVHINALAHIKEHIGAATANVKVKYGFITLLNRNYDLCKELKSNLNKTCPVDEGPIEVSVDVDVPGFIPPGWFHLEATAWRDSDEKQLGRILADVKF